MADQPVQEAPRRQGGERQVCVHYLNGCCRFGARCRFAHDPAAPRPPCVYFQRGFCSRGDACMYRHGAQDARPRPQAAAGAGQQAAPRRPAAVRAPPLRQHQQQRAPQQQRQSGPVQQQRAAPQQQAQQQAAAGCQLNVFRDPTESELEEEYGGYTSGSYSGSEEYYQSDYDSVEGEQEGLEPAGQRGLLQGGQLGAQVQRQGGSAAGSGGASGSGDGSTAQPADAAGQEEEGEQRAAGHQAQREAQQAEREAEREARRLDAERRQRESRMPADFGNPVTDEFLQLCWCVRVTQAQKGDGGRGGCGRGRGWREGGCVPQPRPPGGLPAPSCPCLACQAVSSQQCLLALRPFASISCALHCIAGASPAAAASPPHSICSTTSATGMLAASASQHWRQRGGRLGAVWFGAVRLGAVELGAVWSGALQCSFAMYQSALFAYALVSALFAGRQSFKHSFALAVVLVNKLC